MVSTFGSHVQKPGPDYVTRIPRLANRSHEEYEPKRERAKETDTSKSPPPGTFVEAHSRHYHLTTAPSPSSSCPVPPSFLRSFAFAFAFHSDFNFPTMKSILSLLGSSKKRRSRSFSKADPSSFSSGSGSSSDSSVHLFETPKSVLPCPSFFSPNRLQSDVFKLLDRDGDGRISLHELELLFHRLRVEPPSQEEVAMMLAEADADGDGYISREEFGVLNTNLGPANPPELRDAFDYYDSDGDGRISAEELLGVFSALGDEGCSLEECRRMIEGVDRDGKGFVGFEDFARMMEGFAN